MFQLNRSCVWNHARQGRLQRTAPSLLINHGSKLCACKFKCLVLWENVDPWAFPTSNVPFTLQNEANYTVESAPFTLAYICRMQFFSHLSKVMHLTPVLAEHNSRHQNAFRLASLPFTLASNSEVTRSTFYNSVRYSNSRMCFLWA